MSENSPARRRRKNQGLEQSPAVANCRIMKDRKHTRDLSKATTMPEPATSSVPALLQQAVGLHQRGQLDAARALYAKVLELAPSQFDALHLSGVIARQQGQPERAVQLISRAIAVDPKHAGARCNLGAALQDLGRSGEALASYELAVQLDPNYALAFNNRGNALRKLGKLDEALASYDRALSIKPNYAEAWCHRAMLLQDLGRPGEALQGADYALSLREAYFDAWCARANALMGLERFEEAADSYERALALNADSAQTHCSHGTARKRLGRLELALQSYDRAVSLRPDYATAHHYRANTLRALGRDVEAIAAYRRALELGADAQQVSFALAALGVGDAPDATPTAYVRELFDQYAGHFDEHLVDKLGYQTPALLGAAIRRLASLCDARVLDLGCGTGLMGPFLRPLACTLTGVDLSPRMLDKAREREIYDRLACVEIGEYLDTQAGVFDMVVAADVLVYFGELAPLFGQVRRTLVPGGWFCFSVEASMDAGFALRPSNRYAHSLDYVRRLASAAGFTVCAEETADLRTENGAPVAGYLLVLRAIEP
jgi:predicted TPR repeat methyltransferase